MRQAATGSVLQSFDRLFRTGSSAGWPESELLDRFLFDGDDGAFEALITRFGPMVLTVCRRYLSNPDDVADAFQATFLVLVRRAGSIRHRALLGNWLYGVATKVARRARSKVWSQGQFERLGFDPPEFFAPDGDEPGKADDYRVLHDELARLPEKYRSPLVLCYFEGQTHEQAAERLRWPVGTVRGRLHRGRERLRHRLVARGLESPVPLIATALSPARGFLPLRLVSHTCTLARAISSPSGWALATGASPAGAVGLAKGVISSMSLSPMKLSLVGLATAGLLTTGVASVAYQTETPASGRNHPAVGQYTDPLQGAADQSERIWEARIAAKRSELEASEARREFAQSEADRLQQLANQGSVSTGELQRAIADAKIQTAELGRVRAELDEVLAMLEAVRQRSSRTAEAHDPFVSPTRNSASKPVVASAKPSSSPFTEGRGIADPRGLDARLDAIEAKLDAILAVLSQGGGSARLTPRADPTVAVPAPLPDRFAPTRAAVLPPVAAVAPVASTPAAIATPAPVDPAASAAPAPTPAPAARP
jgi:RNA polymerase sigma factor (sigma-70 family)